MITFTNGFKVTPIPSITDGTTALRAGKSAYQIKRDFPFSTDGLYWIQIDTINLGEPFQIYADMTTDGGGWTLLMTNQNGGEWTYGNALLLNESSPVLSGANYSIVAYGDYIKKSSSGFQYMIEATERGSWGAIWTANGNYSFTNTNNTQTDITINTRFSVWDYTSSGIEQTMPWYSNACGILTTSNDASNDWWGTLISQCGFAPAPWINGLNPNPGIIWYWVR